MFGYLKGTVLTTRRNALILDVHDVGYLVHVVSTVREHVATGSSLALWVYTHETSDTVSLFGFKTEAELDFFELLTSVNGVGPKTALGILEAPMEKVRGLIASGNAKELAKTPGIGPKTAARIVLELKNKMVGGAIDVPDLTPDIGEDVVEALESLGYKKSHVKKILEKLPADIRRTEDIVTWFLRNV